MNLNYYITPEQEKALIRLQIEVQPDFSKRTTLEEFVAERVKEHFDYSVKWYADKDLRHSQIDVREASLTLTQAAATEILAVIEKHKKILPP